ncbi:MULTISPECIES: hypothetical protein [Acinetobacter]|uniref:hypothetical protein n=1 Tax=Acinetobacter TaxID=469 RepID=UPI001436B8CC|nr:MULTISPECIES: hypothetical protein [Acinetobacter]MCA4813452.1 hypothetical protein [Acinetobacter towneri]QIV92214.1 hypothetical protein GVU25_05115 [Acinetobacter towneri]
MTAQTIQQQVECMVKQMQNQGLEPVAVMLGHEDWLLFSLQSKVDYTPFGSARRYQPALFNLLLVRVDEMNAVRVVTQTQLDEFAASNQIL